MKIYVLLILLQHVAVLVSGLKMSGFANDGIEASIAWIDWRWRYRDKDLIIDTFYDRIVSVYLHSGQGPDDYYSNIVTGVFITELLILVSFNPYRVITRNRTLMDHTGVETISARDVAYDYGCDGYETEKYGIECARQVAPPFDHDSLPIDMQHGIHSPLHDLMVIRLKTKLYLNIKEHPRHSFADISYNGITLAREGWYKIREYGPRRTEVARRWDTLEDWQISIASVAFLNDRHIFENRYLEARGNYTGTKFTIVDCDEWIPREWGRFICLKNDQNYTGLGSGAMLFGGNKSDTLYGVGCFCLWKEEDYGILVFTDIRPYWHLMHRTCTYKDKGLKTPDDYLTTTSTEPPYLYDEEGANTG